MLEIYRPSESELMKLARGSLAKAAMRGPVTTATGTVWRLSHGFHRTADPKHVPVPPELSGALSRTGCAYVGARPAAFDKPRYGTPAYAIAVKIGWIAPEEEKADRLAYEDRRRRSLETCHRFNLYEGARYPAPKDSGAYVPALSARLEKDRNLTDGARRCARMIAELTYRKNREGRALDTTVSYLAKALNRCRRTVQRYLTVLEREGYIRSTVIDSPRSRMCIGLVIHLCEVLLAPHHRGKWPDRKAKKPKNPGATSKSQNHSFDYYKKDRRRLISRNLWSLKCMDGVFRAFMKTDPLGLMEKSPPLKAQALT